ncbi:MAG TPA: BNR-4 repeat-containing protein [Candidatus Hydrogenedentes bacterium]|nr:BNR-4 repeat-containing protein [Candidatus Hydrogenedentota bacterium]HOL78104.1 BNR-4 repeat-containing protein [Candidatus Hydrogenedentota bacterium]HPO86471.1 BNR-4 repeat-containing protein [Candidatus Hydrogenedentota bacterium]
MSVYVYIAVGIVVAIMVWSVRVAGAEEPHGSPLICKKDTGYRGIWYSNQPTGDEYAYKYSGGLGTYCANHIPFAIYAPEVNKTFFVYGGTKPTERGLLAMVSYYDHRTKTVPRPTVLLDKDTDDAHDNPVISLDDAGYVWVFVSSHGKSRPSYILRGKTPYEVDEFDLISTTNFSYPQPWFIKDQGFVFLHTSYDPGRFLYSQTSADGVVWSERTLLAAIDEGHYQVSNTVGEKIATAFNYHPKAFQGDPARHGLNWRTNIYYIESNDMGRTWRLADGTPAELPVTQPQHPALVRNYEAEGKLVYLCDINFDDHHAPVILYVVSTSWEPGPEHGPREWWVAHWTGARWVFSKVTTSDSNYDMGSLYIEKDGTWRVIGPTEPGPQPYNPGGEVAVWISRDEGMTWRKRRQVTRGSIFNHTYCRRPVSAHTEFYAFWADGHARRPSESRLYFCDKTGRRVFRLPYIMDKDFQKPERVPYRPGAKSPSDLW